jgi:hypothetical protein
VHRDYYAPKPRGKCLRPKISGECGTTLHHFGGKVIRR